MNDAEKAYQYFLIAVPENEEQAKAYFWARKALQPTLTPPNEWVSVEDGLPENYTDVLCWYEYFRYGDHNQMYQTCGIGYCINGQWGGEVSNGTKCKVLYWQPLPTPPYRRPLEGGEDT